MSDDSASDDSTESESELYTDATAVDRPIDGAPFTTVEASRVPDDLDVVFEPIDLDDIPGDVDGR